MYWEHTKYTRLKVLHVFYSLGSHKCRRKFLLPSHLTDEVTVLKQFWNLLKIHSLQTAELEFEPRKYGFKKQIYIPRRKKNFFEKTNKQKKHQKNNKIMFGWWDYSMLFIFSKIFGVFIDSSQKIQWVCDRLSNLVIT